MVAAGISCWCHAVPELTVHVYALWRIRTRAAGAMKATQEWPGTPHTTRRSAGHGHHDLGFPHSSRHHRHRYHSSLHVAWDRCGRRRRKRQHRPPCGVGCRSQKEQEAEEGEGDGPGAPVAARESLQGEKLVRRPLANLRPCDGVWQVSRGSHRRQPLRGNSVPGKDL